MGKAPLDRSALRTRESAIRRASRSMEIPMLGTCLPVLSGMTARLLIFHEAALLREGAKPDLYLLVRAVGQVADIGEGTFAVPRGGVDCSWTAGIPVAPVPWADADDP